MVDHRVRRIGGALCCVVFLLSLGTAAVGQPPAGDAFPFVGGGGPPDWVAAGTRLTWYGEVASVATGYYTYVEDPDGDWEDPVTRKRYRRTDEEDMPTAAARAYSQTDVLAVEGDDVVINSTLWGIDLETGLLGLTPLWGGRLPGAAVDGAWIRADLLAGVQSGGTRDLQVLRGPYQLGDTAVDSVGFLDRAKGDYASTVFDAASGVLIASTGRYKATGSPVHGPLDLPEGNVLIVVTRFVSTRDRALPGLGAPNPAWVVPGVELRYSGSATYTNPFDPSGFSVTYPVEVTVTIDDAGTGWATYASQTATNLNGYVERSQSHGATGSTGLYWYDPAALAQLSTGDVLDVDPTTGARLTVDSAGAPGMGAVKMRTELPGVTVVATYDPDRGILTGLTIEQALTFATVELQLTSVG